MNIKQELEKEANQILEKTAKEQERYKNERILLFSIMENLNSRNDVKIFEQIIKSFNRVLELEEEIRKYNNIILELQKIAEEQIRKEDMQKINGRINLFEVKDISGETYTFFSRKNANEYIKINNDKFNKGANIVIIKNNNIDLEKLIDKIRDNK